MKPQSQLPGRPLAALLSLVLTIALAPAQDAATDIADLLRLKDDADPALITRIAASKSREGAEGLVKAFDACGSILMRREVVRGLAKFDGSDEAEKPAMGKIASIATTVEEPELREAALLALGQSTRFAAVEALAAMKHKKVVPLLIEQMQKDPGRMARRIGDILWEMTAQPFEEDYARWAAWWKESGETFEIVGESDLHKAEKAREMRRLTQRTKAPAKFFGLEIQSHKVIFG